LLQVTQVGTIRQLAGAAAKEEVVDWDEMAKLVTTAAGKRELSQLRSTIQDLIQKATVPVRALRQPRLVSRGVCVAVSPLSLIPPCYTPLHCTPQRPCRNCVGRN
jgi:hypothetical protein